MPELPELESKTVEKVYQSYVKGSGDWRRDHLGASVIGQECERKIWYGFRWCTKPSFDGRMLRLFATGYSQEKRLLQDLKEAGISVYDRDPETGSQIHYTDFGGHYSGSLDAIAKGFPEAPETFHVVECKTMNTKTFNQLKTKGVKLVKFEHYCQMQVYMGWAGLDRAFYFAVCKETDELYEERVYFERAVADRLRIKADRVVFANTPLHKITDDIDNFKCRYCDHKFSCHDTKLPEVNCRTCAFADTIDSGWKCARDGHTLEPLAQREACPRHVFIPELVPLTQTDADNDKGWIMYGDITNGFGATASKNLQALIP